MFEAPGGLFEVITRALRPHYSKCMLTGLRIECGDECRCSEISESKMYSHGLDVMKYTWFVQDVFVTHAPDFEQKIRCMHSVSKEVAMRFVYRYLGKLQDPVVEKLDKDLVRDILGDCPLNLPIDSFLL